MITTYHYGYECMGDKSRYGIDSQWWPNMSCYSCPIIDFSADFHIFGVEINATALRWYVDDPSNTIFTLDTPTLCLSDPDFMWGKTRYAPFQPVYSILNVAVSGGANITWWQNNPNGVETLIDSVRYYEFIPSNIDIEIGTKIE
jgi:beta-glucanase (GH16 family)